MVNLKKYLGDFFELCASNGTIIGAEIGRGGSGWVYEGTLSKPFPGDFSGSTQCAVKLIEYNQKNKAYVDREINTQLGLDHPNVVRDGIGFKAIVMEKMELSLDKYVREKPERRIPENEVRKFTRQIVSGLVYIHGKGYTHRDLKMANALMKKDKLTGEYIIKICDLEFVKESKSVMKSFVGTLPYLPPELESPYGPELDSWSLGIMIYYMLEGKYPFDVPKCTRENCYAHIRMLNEISKSTANLNLPGSFTPAARDFVERLLSFEPKLRLTFEQLRTHPFLLDPITVHVALGPCPRDCFGLLQTVAIETETLSLMLKTRAPDNKKVVLWDSVAEYVLKKLRERGEGGENGAGGSATPPCSLSSPVLPPDVTARDARIFAYSPPTGAGRVVRPNDFVEPGTWEAVMYFAPSPQSLLPTDTALEDLLAAAVASAPEVSTAEGERLLFKAGAAEGAHARVGVMLRAVEAHLRTLEKCDAALTAVSRFCERAHGAIAGVEAVCVAVVKGPVTDALTEAYGAVARVAELVERRRAPGLHILIPQRTVEPLRAYEDRKVWKLRSFYEVRDGLAEALAQGPSLTEAADSDDPGLGARVAELMGLCQKVRDVVGVYRYVYERGVETFVGYWRTLVSALGSLNFLCDTVVPAAEAVAAAGKAAIEAPAEEAEAEAAAAEAMFGKVDEYNAVVFGHLSVQPSWLAQQYIPAEKKAVTREEMLSQIERLEMECMILRDENALLRKRLGIK